MRSEIDDGGGAAHGRNAERGSVVADEVDGK